MTHLRRGRPQIRFSLTALLEIQNNLNEQGIYIYVDEGLRESELESMKKLFSAVKVFKVSIPFDQNTTSNLHQPNKPATTVEPCIDESH